MKQQTMTKLVEDYLIMKRRLGFDMKHNGSQLLCFAHFADNKGHRGPLTLELAVQWATWNANRSITSARRIDVLRPFVQYLTQFDISNEIPPPHLFGPSHRRLVPHIYSSKEVQTLMQAALQLPSESGLRAVTYETFFGLLAATGLRLSEALQLMCHDVDLRAGLITVRQTKFRKTRLVPLHPSTKKALQRYADLRDQKVPQSRCDDFFLLEGGRQLKKRTVAWQFQQLREQLHWRSRGDYLAPRIHDFRHSFICHCLLRWYQQGINIDKHILALSTYVGHAKVTDTYWYITGIPELMAITAQRFEQFVQEDLT